MKILMVSMNSIHFVRWTEQLKDSGHEVFWFDILDGGRAEGLPWVHQITGWKQKYPSFKGRYFLKKRVPFLYKKLSFLFENNTEKVFEKVLQDIKPDVVHSVVMYISCTPILNVMQKHSHLPWIYSSWGSDLYYFKNIPSYKEDILRVLPRVNYLITDCKRDISIARELGFKGQVLGTFPGGGGFDYNETDAYIKPITERTTILVKGYQGRSGRAIEVIKALELIKIELELYQIIVFGADKEVENYITEHGISQKVAVKVLPRSNFLTHAAILKLMGEALVYIGNSNSDGMPNTLLEAIAQGAFPIQSNPGGASSEVIKHGENGFLIEDCNDSEAIKELIVKVVSNSGLIEKAFIKNQNNIKPRFEITRIKTQVLNAYNEVLKS
ncbi:glycosyltransferase [Mariniflexile sp. AS56]|uniref:glycosyltransferase n=1 Tax=Mariniflexile sp. AS56 TaxID=3063957 RepID=UPI0026EF80B5|nr:glycosyltransferase [Mariniflexile sp. AS56]MDO7172722.1 glycosyltransferase [Mariniflexile sp. AS56]